MRCAVYWFRGITFAAALLPALAFADVGTVWVRTYAQPGYCNDEATAMFVDRAGNVYVTGSSQAVEMGQKDFATVKYNSAGVQQWAERFSGIGNSIPYAIAVDGAGNVYVTGASESTGVSYDFLTIKYNSAGVLQWHDRYNGAANGDDRALSVCVDSSDNVAVCGYVAGVSTSNDWTTIGYSSAGARRFVTPRTSSGGNPDEANSIIADPQGNYYVAGRFWSGGTNKADDASVVKYSSAGVEQWVVNYDGPLSGDGAVAICRSAAGDLYATGWSVGPSDNADVLTMKVSAAGALLWAKRHAAPENGNDMGTRIVVDASGNVRVLGRVQVGSGGDYDLVTIGYGSDSTEQFVNRLNSGGYAVPGGLAVDKEGHILVGSELAGDFLTIQYNASSEAWRRAENYGSGDGATAIGVDDSGYVYVTGRGDFGANAWDFVIIKYDPSAGVEETPITEMRATSIGPTIVRGILFLSPATSHQPQAASLLDISGRRVLDLHPGVNDVRALAPGVYFVRAASREPSAVSCYKVVVTS
jgi:hypothetical protein